MGNADPGEAVHITVDVGKMHEHMTVEVVMDDLFKGALADGGMRAARALAIDNGDGMTLVIVIDGDGNLSGIGLKPLPINVHCAM